MARVAMLVPVLLVGCVGRHVEIASDIGNEPAASTILEAKPVLIPGEEAIYSLHVLEVPIGKIEMRTAAIEERDGRAVTWVSTVIQTDGVLEMVMALRDEVSTLLDFETGQPVATRGTFVELLTGRPDPDAGVEAPWGYPDREHHNGHSLLLALRGWDAEPGARANTTLISRTNSNGVELVYVGSEVVSTELGVMPAERVEGTIAHAASNGDPFHFVLWRSNDITRAVLRLDSDTDIGLVASARIAQYAAP